MEAADKDKEPIERLDMRSVLGKTDMILDAFTIDDNSLSLAELVRRTGLPKTTVHRICQVSTTWGVLERDADGYRLGLRLFELGQRVPRQRIVRDAAHPYLHDLLFETKAVVHLAVLDGPEAMVIERLSPYRAQTRLTQVAGRMPLHCTALGKALLAFSHPSTVTEVMRKGLRRRTPYTITSALLFTQALERARSTGVTTEDEEMHVGYLGVGAPIFGFDKTLIAAISATAPVHSSSVATLSPTVARTAAAISAALTARAT